MMKKTEKRTMMFDVRADPKSESNVIIGTPIVFESKTDLGYFYEKIDRKALDNADLSDVRFLVNHDMDSIPLARYCAGSAENTMQLRIEPDGLKISVELDTENNSEAKSLYSAVRRGDITGMSFAFNIDGERWDDLDTDKPTRTLTSISRVFEVSAVTFPAYQSTDIKARNAADLENAKETLRQVRSKNDVELAKLKAKYLYEI